MATTRSVLVYGGTGALGVDVIKKFKEAGYTTFSVDFSKSNDATHSIILTKKFEDDVKLVLTELGKLKAALDTVVCVAGGFVMGNIHDDNIFSNLDRMWNFNVQSAVAVSHVASKFLKEGGLLYLTGASGALKPTPGTLAYGISKVATHHLIASLAEPNSGLPKNVTVFGICPIMLDTQANRNAMPGADTSTWTPLPVLASKLLEWSTPGHYPPNGSLFEPRTAKGNTEWVLVKSSH